MAGAATVALSLMALPAVASAHTTASAPARASAAAGGTCNGQPAPWMDARLSPDQRAKLLIANMTLAQEVQETATISTPWRRPLRMAR